MITIIDFGSQYTQLIARRVREMGVYCEVIPWNVSPSQGIHQKCLGFILSGSPASAYEPDAPTIPTHILNSELPILGICYGMQCLVVELGGRVFSLSQQEYGLSRLEVINNTILFGEIPSTLDVWMSHGDGIEKLPPNLYSLAKTSKISIAAMADRDNRLFGVMFHPEVAHTEFGAKLLRNFVIRICGCKETWNPSDIIIKSVSTIQSQIGNNRAICAVSGGVDSTVAAILAQRAIGNRLTCVFVDHGLLRKNEADEVIKLLSDALNTSIVFVDASARFLSALRGISDPEQKRSIIGELFIRVFELEAKKREISFLIQGTLYSDIIESSTTGNATMSFPKARIKSHHNVGGLPTDMELILVEPLRKLFKDEVRRIGRVLNLPDEILFRHPFPGPGLAIRCIGEINQKRLNTLRSIDDILLQELQASELYRESALAFAVLLPVRSVGVMGDARRYGEVVALRVVTSEDLMTADWKRLPGDFLAQLSSRIVNEVSDVNRVVYDITSKPPATIDWE